jgi:MYXO-CTERM domain-containing protein
VKDLFIGLLIAAALLIVGSANAQPNLVKSLPLPAGDHEWNTIAMSPTGDRLYVGDYVNTVAVLETATDTLVDTLELPSPDDEWIGGIAISPEGRLFVSTDIAFYELDPSDGTVLQQTAVPWSSWWEGPMVFTDAGDRAYLASVYEVFVLQVDPLEIIDTIPGDEIDGLLAVNTQWGSDGLDAYNITISLDQDRLYLGGDDGIKVIGGLSTTTDFSGLTLARNTEGTPSPRIRLSPDGTLLFDAAGNVWNAQDLSLVDSFDFAGFFSPVGFVLAPSGGGVIFEGWSGNSGTVTYTGEALLVADRTSMTVVDLDGSSSNGITGIDLPEANGWDTMGSYNGLAMMMHPSGDKVYMATGASGGLVASLDAAPIQDLTDFYPRRGGNEGDVTLTIAQAYPDGSTVALQSSGQDVVVAYETVSLSGRLEGVFDLRGVAEGDYKVVVTPAGATQPIELEGVFKVEPVREDASVEMMGESILSYATEATGRIIVQNTGNVDLRDIIVTLQLATGTRYRINLPANVPGGAEQRDEEYTVAEGIEPIWIDRLKAGRSYEFELVLAGPDGIPPSDWDISLQATVGYLTAGGGEPAATPMNHTVGVSQSPLIGELCTIGDAMVTAASNELDRRNTGTARGDVGDAMGRVVRDTAVEYGVSKVKELVAKGLTILVVAAVVPAALPIAAVVFTVVNDMKSCFDFISKLFKFGSVFSIDPNDKISSTGLDGFIEGNETIRYLIQFENLPDATAPAKLVTVTDPLDPVFDLSSFQLVGTSHPDEISVTVDPATRVMTAVFSDVDLPPNVTPPEGQGWLEFTIRPKDLLSHGTVVRNQAEIVFDINDPIVTPEVVLEVDTAPPLSTMEALPAETVGTEIPVTWNGDDQGGVGIWDYTVKVSTNDGAFEPWLQATSDTQATFAGAVGKTYRFQVVARDRFGNVETKVAGDVETKTVSSGAGGGEAGDDGCGCRTAGSGHFTGVWALLLGALALVFRRRVLA